jgi:thymidine kinase
VLELIPLAEQVTKLTAVCKLCYKDAAFTKRMSADTAVEVIGGSEMYMPVCRQCFNEDGLETPKGPSFILPPPSLRCSPNKRGG